MLYSGMRVNELLKNEIVNVNFEEKYIYVPKNLAKNKESERKVPMHDRVLPLVRSFVDNPIGIQNKYHP
ncbi:MAG: tyrosine-type recombinase/integrase [Roseburia sp.]